MHMSKQKAGSIGHGRLSKFDLQVQRPQCHCSVSTNVHDRSSPEWHFQNLTAAGIIPQPLTKRNCKSIFEHF